MVPSTDDLAHNCANQQVLPADIRVSWGADAHRVIYVIGFRNRVVTIVVFFAGDSKLPLLVMVWH